MRVQLALAVALLGQLSSGCLPHVDDTRIYDERPLGEPRSAEERRQPAPDITSSVSGNTARITAVQRTECRNTTTTPVEREEGTGHSLHNGTLAQGINLALAGALIAGGVAIYAAADSSSCTTTPAGTANNPNPSPVPCTPQQQQTQTTQVHGMGIVVGTAAILPLGAFVWNIVRAKDETKTEQIPPSIVATDWKTCATAPLANRRITIEAGGTTITGQTDERGAATLDVSPVASAAADPQNGTLHIDGGNAQASTKLSLTTTPAYAAWKQAAEIQARFSRQATMIQDMEGSLASLDAVITRLEHTPDPWGNEQVPDLQQFMTTWRHFQVVSESFKGEAEVDPRLGKRLLAIPTKLARLAPRLPNLKAHVDKMAARKQAEDEFLVGLIATTMRNQADGASFSSGGSSTPAADDSRVRDLERRQSDLEEQRRRDQADAAQRKADDDARRNVARNECSERCWSRAVFGACNDSCGTNDLSCRNRCSDTAQRCQQDCQSR